MRKTLSAAVLLICILIFSFHASAEAVFSSNPDAIEQAAKSVLMLQVFDDSDELIATGSGFVAFNNRTLITNHHVIEGASWILANSDDGFQYIVNKVYIADEEKDIAICGFLSPTDLIPLEMNIDGQLKRAEGIVAIGSPIGITNTVSLGNISALYKEDGVSWIQFTAPISSGSSGGALFDNSGRIIGVTSASYIDTQNINLAVHISEADKLYKSWDGEEWTLDEFEAITHATPTPVPTATPKIYSFLRKGDSGEEVRLLQKKLIELGYLDGIADGIFDQKTEDAVFSFNVQNFGRKEKIVQPKMQEYLFEDNPKPYVAPTPTPKPTATPKPTPVPTATPEPYPVLRKGDKGEEVKRLQQRLIELGYLDGTADGIFGNKTEEAVKLFQRSYLYLLPTGEATNKTQQLLFGSDAKVYSDPKMSLDILDDAKAEWDYIKDDQLVFRVQVSNTAKLKAASAFELYIYATDVWGEKIYENTIYRWTTNKKVAPGKTVFSDYIAIPNSHEIDKVYCGVHKIAYTDGSIHETVQGLVYYSSWEIG